MGKLTVKVLACDGVGSANVGDAPVVTVNIGGKKRTTAPGNDADAPRYEDALSFSDVESVDSLRLELAADDFDDPMATHRLENLRELSCGKHQTTEATWRNSDGDVVGTAKLEFFAVGFGKKDGGEYSEFESPDASPEKKDRSCTLPRPDADEEPVNNAKSLSHTPSERSASQPGSRKSSHLSLRNEQAEAAKPNHHEDSRSASDRKLSASPPGEDASSSHVDSNHAAVVADATSMLPAGRTTPSLDRGPSRPMSKRQTAALPPLGRRNHATVATIRYPGERALNMAEVLDPSKPLVKSTLPLTRPQGPSFVEAQQAEERKKHRVECKVANSSLSRQISDQRENERKYLKAQQEFDREKKLAERAIYHRERVAQWSTRLAASPLAVDLVADHERIEEESAIRSREERRRRVLAEKRRRKVKNEIVVKALAEVPLLDEARRQKREMLEEERRDKALRDVQRVEAIQERKIRDMETMDVQRRTKLDQRLMGH